MPAPRKTVQVSQMVSFVNTQLRNSQWTPEEKRGMYVVLDRILHDSNQYAGFNYVDPYDPEDPEFEIGGRKEVSRKYYMKSNTINNNEF